MSDNVLARRTDCEIFFEGVDITSSIKKYFCSLTYTDNEEDEADDLQIKLHDRENIWLESWLNTAIEAAAEEKTAEISKKYRVIAKSGAAVRSSTKDKSKVQGTVSFGTIIEVKKIEEGWAQTEYFDKTGYIRESYLQAVYTDLGNPSDAEVADEACKGLKIRANIIRQNRTGNGESEKIECGQFELDSVTAQGPPAVINIKGTSLPYGSTIRQTRKSKSWENYTHSGIANEIAAANGMTCMFLSEKDTAYQRVEQYKVSDIAFLQKLSHDAGCSLKVTNNILVIFDQAAYEAQEPIRIIPRGKAGGYSKYNLSTAKNDVYASCRISYVDPSGRLIEATAYADGYDKEKEDNQCLELQQKVNNEAEALVLAEKMLRLHNKYEFVATFTFPGDPFLIAGCVVELKNWGAWSGRYIIKQAKHSVSRSGYTTQVTLRRVMKA